jgi:hypothetical protein
VVTDQISLAISALQTRRQSFAESALSNPQDRSQFEFGRACGTFAGLTMAIDTINGILDDADARERAL